MTDVKIEMEKRNTTRSVKASGKPGNIRAFQVYLSQNYNARIEIVVVNVSEKKISFCWIRRGATRRKTWDFQHTHLSRTRHDNKLVITCEDGKRTKWHKGYFFDSVDKAEELCSIIAPSVTIDCPLLFITEHKLYDKKTKKYKQEEKNDLLNLDLARELVSLKKKRFKHHQYNLDMTYITPRIIAMGLPCVGSEATYRNPLGMVQEFFEEFHTERNGEDVKYHYLIVNLCEVERQYDKKNFHGQVVNYPHDDHNPPPFSAIIDFCMTMEKFLRADEHNVIAVHCKAGKGRTGTFISTFLVHMQAATDAASAILYFAQQRTYNAKGITIPSQMRWVHYYETFMLTLQEQQKPVSVIHHSKFAKLVLKNITIHNPPVAKDKNGTRPYVEVLRYWQTKRRAEPEERGIEPMESETKKESIFNFLEQVKVQCKRNPNLDIKTLLQDNYTDKGVDVKNTINLEVQGDLKFILRDAGHDCKGDAYLCHFWVNTTFLEKTIFHLPKSQIDVARKDKKCKKFPPGFAITLEFDQQSLVRNSAHRMSASNALSYRMRCNVTDTEQETEQAAEKEASIEREPSQPEGDAEALATAMTSSKSGERGEDTTDV